MIQCPHMMKEGRNTFCAAASSRLGRLFFTNEPLCRLWCQKKGPFEGRELSHEQEKIFVQEAWQMHYRQEPTGSLAAKVLETYQKPADIATPEEWPQIQQDLDFLYKVPGFQAILITGSAVASNAPRPLKDIDISLWFESTQSLMAFRSSGTALPANLAGVKADYFYYIGSDFPDQFFVTIDPLRKRLYLSRWFKLNLRTLEEGYEVIQNPMLPMDDVLKKLIDGVGTDKLAPVRNEWTRIRHLWDKAQSFVTSAATRGLVATGMDAAGLESSGGIKAAPEVVSQRERSCFGGEGQFECELLQRGPDGPYCGGCGCGPRNLALLKRADGGYNKLEYPHLACPLKKPGFSNHVSQLTPETNPIAE